MFKGRVIYFNEQTQFGIIQKLEGGGVFVDPGSIHDSGLTTLFEGQQLNFDVVNEDKIERAINLIPLFQKKMS